MSDGIRQAAAAGRPTFGGWLSLADPLGAEAMGRAGYDWVILDAQHGGLGWHNMLSTIQAVELGGTPAFVRVGWNDPMQIMRAVDLGAAGVVVPMVSTAAQARMAAEAIRYPPRGNRSFGPVRTYHAHDPLPGTEPICLVMIETAEALANMADIAATDGVDGLFVGPVDLAYSLGYGLSLTMPPAVLDAVDAVVAACAVTGAIAGCAAIGIDTAATLIGRGVTFVALGSDIAMIRRGAAAEVAHARALAPPAEAR